MNILITGGASGFGEAITRKLAQNSENKLYITYNNSASKANELASAFPNVTPVKCNFTDQAEILALKDQLKGMDLDVLVNNAYTGEAIKSYFHKIPADQFLNDFQANIMPTIVLTQAAIDGFRKKKFGKIITVLTSFLVNNPPTGSSVYIANKAYLEQLTKVWANENSRYNITSNSVSPSFMLTNFTNSTDERIVEEMISNHPLKKILTTDEAAEAVHFLVSATQQINGVNIVLNSGVNIK